MNSTDRELIKETLDGHGEAFGHLVERHQDRVFNVLVRFLGSIDDARDVTQDAFIHAYQKLDTFRGKSAFSTWLHRIAMNAAISRCRKRRLESGSIDAARESAGIEPVDQRSDTFPSHSLEMAERRELVWKAIDELSDEFRAVIVLKEIDGLKYDEIAEVVEVPIGTVRSRIHRGRAELREKLRVIFEAECSPQSITPQTPAVANVADTRNEG
ncbi:RNA polymerase sigma factor [Stratiformator vulcanicus]|uniref:ECF RNA polymerase sigma factor SigW n=1 Tax=Stratiformator vulcanicus TaxID=2527980 RepID=A0A517R3M3_9PLAN|nr:sigma-70 family RNA polymerase sigma factor [Stratiformator vulcanicus]QDT38440.1 ECF RNA polymerase sigma factor SigW [Stratiformator vulcanicus]